MKKIKKEIDEKLNRGVVKNIEALHIQLDNLIL